MAEAMAALPMDDTLGVDAPIYDQPQNNQQLNPLHPLALLPDQQALPLAQPNHLNRVLKRKRTHDSFKEKTLVPHKRMRFNYNEIDQEKELALQKLKKQSVSKRRKKPNTAPSKRNKFELPKQLPFNIGKFYSEIPFVLDDAEKLDLCNKFYDDDILREKLIPLITQKHVVSLRSLDWLATNYAKKYRVVIFVKNGDEQKMVNIYTDYGDWLKRHHRVKFDPFRRRKRVYFQFEGRWYETTVGQLLFLYWAISSGILEYAEKHIEEIDRDMNQSMAETRKEKERAKKNGQRRKRKELSRAPPNACVIYKVPLKTSFTNDSSSSSDDDEECHDVPFEE